MTQPSVEVGTPLLQWDYALVVKRVREVAGHSLVDLWDAVTPSLVFSTVICEGSHTIPPEEWL